MSIWEWPQWAIAGLVVLSLAGGLCKDIDNRTTSDFPWSIVANVLFCWVLWMGGFWS